MYLASSYFKKPHRNNDYCPSKNYVWHDLFEKFSSKIRYLQIILFQVVLKGTAKLCKKNLQITYEIVLF